MIFSIKILIGDSSPLERQVLDTYEGTPLSSAATDV